MNQAKPINKSTAEPINSNDGNGMHQYETAKKRQKVIKQECHGLSDNERLGKENKNSIHLLTEYEKKVSNFMSSGFSHNCELFLRKLACDSSIGDLASKYPLLKILKVVLKKMMLNDFEMVYWVALLDTGKWGFHDLVEAAASFPDLLTSSEYVSLAEYKALLLYLILTAYLIKLHLNEPEETLIFESYLKSIWPAFLEYFPSFEESHRMMLPHLKPLTLNTVYKRFATLEKIAETPNEFYDYNSLVDEIIHISPPYNYDRYENANPTGFMEPHLTNPGFLSKIEKNPSYNLPSELPKFGRETSMNLNLNDFRLPSMLKKESNVGPASDIFRADSIFQDPILNRNDSFGGILDNFPMSFGLARNNSVGSEFEGNMKLEDNNVNFNRHLLNLPSLISSNSEAVDPQQKIGENETEIKSRKGKEGFKLTKNQMGHSGGGQGLFHKGPQQE